MTRESPFMKRLLVALSALPGVRVHRQNAGKLVVVDPKTGARRAFQAAPPGAADISGIVAPTGMRLEVETKAARGRVRAAQDRWAAMIREMGGVYVRVAYDEDESMDANVAAACAAVGAAIRERYRTEAPPTDLDDEQTEF